MTTSVNAILTSHDLLPSALPEDNLVFVDCETHGLQARLTAEAAFYFGCTLTVPANHVKGQKLAVEAWWSVDELVQYLNEACAAGAYLVMHNAKFDYSVLTLRGLRVPIHRVLCTQTLAYLLDNQRGEYSLAALTGLKEDLMQALVAEELIPPTMTAREFWNSDYSEDHAMLTRLLSYCHKDVRATAVLYKTLCKSFSDKPTAVKAYFSLEQPMLEALINLEQHGALIDEELMLSLLKTSSVEVQELTAEVQESVGYLPKLSYNEETGVFEPVAKEYKSGTFKNSLHVPPFYTDNHGIFVRSWEGHKDDGQPLVVGSHCPLLPFNAAAATGHVWWVLKRECPEALDGIKKTKVGKPQINKDFISDVAELLPPTFPIGKLAKATKRLQMATTIAKHVQADGRIRCDFAHTRTLTGRLATSNPNLQNLPRSGKDEDSQRFRKLFVASPGNVLLCADLDQIELRVLAYYLALVCKDTGLAEEFNGSDPDAHTKNARTWGVERNVAKTLIFLLVYGGQPKLMVERKLFKTLAEAKAAFQGVQDNQPSIAVLMAKVIKKAAERGYIRTIGGRHLYYPDLNSSNKYDRMRAERQCFNALIQGGARDVMHTLIVQTLPHVKEARAGLVNVVHDECLVEVAEDKADALLQKLNGVWERRPDLLPGVLVNGTWNKGCTWFEAK